MNTIITSDDDGGAVDFDEEALRRIDLNLLVVFAMVIRCGSVQAAARRLYLGPSGVSMALNRLRAITSDALFIRGAGGLEPTAFAERLFERISPALAMIGGAMRPQSFDPGSASGTVRAGLSEDLEIVLAPRLERVLAARAPALRLTIRHGDYRRVPKLLDDGAVDLAVTARPAALESRHRCEDLFTESFVVLGGGRTPADGAVLTLDDYLRMPHALVSASGAARGRIDDLLAEHGLERNVRVVTESFAALPFLLRSGELLANVPRTAGLALARSFGLAVRELPIASPSFPVAMAWRTRDESNAALAWVRELVREEVRELALEKA